MRDNYFYSTKDLSKSQNRNIAYYLYQISSEINYEEHEECQELYNALVSACDIKEHSKKVIQAVIDAHIESKRLTIEKEHDDKEQNDCERFINSRVKLKVLYKEDYDISSRHGRWSTKTEDDINLVRAVFAGTPDWFSKIVAYTFFVKADKRRKRFTIPEEFPLSPNVADTNYLSKDGFARFMVDEFMLSEVEGKILNIAYISTAVKEFNHLFKSIANERDESIISFYKRCLGLSLKTILTNLRKDKKLVSYDLVDEDGRISDDARNCIYDGKIDTLFADVLTFDNKKEYYALNSFSVRSDEIELALKLLKNDGSVNILLYGAPGAGKTQFARSLVHSIGMKSLIFKNELEVGDDSDKGENLCRLNSLLSLSKKDSVIIVDEAEGVLKTQSSFFGMKISLPQKGLINKMLENSTNKVIWILNYTHELDESTRRRFTYSIKFNEMSRSMLKSIAENKLNKIQMSSHLQSELVDLCGKYHVTGASVDNMVKTVSGMDLSHTEEQQIVNDVKKVLESNSALIYEKKKMREAVRSSYSLSVLNTSIPPEEIVDMVVNAHEFTEKNESNKDADGGIRMLFYGLSGTGKTELARYIAEKLNKKILLKRASDILGMYVGESEEHIRKAFEEAEASGDILLFDEADTFFADRSTAVRSWERSMVNEFLTQMEEFPGILICTTNLRQIMDPAMQRRFHILAEFKALRREGILELLESFFSSYTFSEELISLLARYNTVTPGDFGSLSGKLRFMPQNKITPQLIIDELCKIQEEKESNCRGIGFAG